MFIKIFLKICNLRSKKFRLFFLEKYQKNAQNLDIMHYRPEPYPSCTHYTKIYSPKGNPYKSFNQNIASYQDGNNEYYREKILDDHRLDRALLKRPAFLIKQPTLYPNIIQQPIVSSRLNYADNLLRTRPQRFYTLSAEEQRIATQGQSPFYQQSALLQSKMHYLKRSSRSKLNSGSRPNLGIKSYEVLQNRENPQKDTQREREPPVSKLHFQTSSERRQRRSPTEKTKYPIQSDRTQFYIKEIKRNQEQKQKQRSKNTTNAVWTNYFDRIAEKTDEGLSDQDDMFYQIREEKMSQKSGVKPKYPKYKSKRKPIFSKKTTIPNDLKWKGKTYFRLL